MLVVIVFPFVFSYLSRDLYVLYLILYVIIIVILLHPCFGGSVSTFEEACFLALKKYVSFAASVLKVNMCLVGIE